MSSLYLLIQNLEERRLPLKAFVDTELALLAERKAKLLAEGKDPAWIDRKAQELQAVPDYLVAVDIVLSELLERIGGVLQLDTGPERDHGVKLSAQMVIDWLEHRAHYQEINQVREYLADIPAKLRLTAGFSAEQLAQILQGFEQTRRAQA